MTQYFACSHFYNLSSYQIYCSLDRLCYSIFSSRVCFHHLPFLPIQKIPLQKALEYFSPYDLEENLRLFKHDVLEHFNQYSTFRLWSQIWRKWSLFSLWILYKRKLCQINFLALLIQEMWNLETKIYICMCSYIEAIYKMLRSNHIILKDQWTWLLIFS